MEAIFALVILLALVVAILLIAGGIAAAGGQAGAASARLTHEVKEQGKVRIRYQGEMTRRVMQAEAKRYLDEVYEHNLAAIEEKYQLPVTPSIPNPNNTPNAHNTTNTRSNR